MCPCVEVVSEKGRERGGERDKILDGGWGDRVMECEAFTVKHGTVKAKPGTVLVEIHITREIEREREREREREGERERERERERGERERERERGERERERERERGRERGGERGVRKR